MKAYMRDAENKKRKKQFHGAEIRLTIGMIVKNEEKTLGKCLASLKPLLDEVPSELIITDTGSTDHTVEIAEKYTDHIIHFEWCNDFSAARNTGLKAARGEWFMFIDGDEWFEDVTEIINFFKSGECDHYGSASYKQRNYKDQNAELFSDFVAVRIFRNYAGMHFQNIVHEVIIKMEPTKYLSAYAHHFGYVFNCQEDLINKFQRNASLLEKILKQNPNDLRSLYQLSREYLSVGDFQKTIEYSKKGLEREKIRPDPIWRTSLQFCLAEVYFKCSAHQLLLDTVEGFFEANRYEEVDYMNFYYMLENSAFRVKQYEKAIQYGQKYLGLYKRYQEHKLDLSRLAYQLCLYMGPNNEENAIRLIGWSYLLKNDDERAVAWLNQIDLSFPHSIPIWLHSFCFAVAKQSGNWDIISDFYSKVLSFGDNEKKHEFMDCTLAYISKNPNFRSDVLSALSKWENSDEYAALCQLCCVEESGEK